MSSVEKNHKYIIGYLHNDRKFKPLYRMLPQISAYEKSHDKLEKNDSIWNKVSVDIKIFDSKFVYTKNLSKTKIKFYGNEVTDI